MRPEVFHQSAVVFGGAVPIRPLAVLERIATDPQKRLSQTIDDLRDTAVN